MALPDDQTMPPNLPQDANTSNVWDPSTISNIIFSAIMVFIGIIAIWQAHRTHLRTTRALDQEQLIGIQLLSRASSMLSDSSHNAHDTLPTSLSRQAASTSHSEETLADLTSGDGLDRLHGLDAPYDIGVDGEPCS